MAFIRNPLIETSLGQCTKYLQFPPTILDFANQCNYDPQSNHSISANSTHSAFHLCLMLLQNTFFFFSQLLSQLLYLRQVFGCFSACSKCQNCVSCACFRCERVWLGRYSVKEKKKNFLESWKRINQTVGLNVCNTFVNLVINQSLIQAAA